MTNYDVIIIGSGPAGLTAAIYAARANLTTVIFEAEMPGGKLTKTYEIANYPGIQNISGADLAMQMMDHVASFNVETIYAGVTAIRKDGDIFTVETAFGDSYTAKAVIVATGTQENKLALPHAEELTGRGVSYCAVCDGAFYRGKDVVVIGGGNSALEESLYLTNLVHRVYIVIRRDVFRADATVVDKVRANEKITVIPHCVPVEIMMEDGKVCGLTVRNVVSGERMDLPCSGIFPYIGATASTGFLAGLGVTDDKGYIVVNNNMETAVKGLYGAGDVTVKDLRQVVTATNDGAIAANSAARYLDSLKTAAGM